MGVATMSLGLLLASFAIVSARAEYELCGQYDTHYTSDYAWNNNVWNEVCIHWRNGIYFMFEELTSMQASGGYTCTYVVNDPDQNDNAFHVLWYWTGSSGVVHAFPNIGLRSDLLPVKLQDLLSLNIDASWLLSPSSLIAGASADPNTKPDSGAIVTNDIQANVCIDVFADEDEERALVFSEQRYEIMVWFGHFGDGALPVGNTAPLDPPVVVLVQDAEFKLYNGTNLNGQFVFTWVANETLTDFNMDLAPLFGFLAYHGFLPLDLYLGTVQFGTETYSSDKQVNFTVTSFSSSMRTYNSTDNTTLATDGNGTSIVVANATTTIASGDPSLPEATQPQIPEATQVEHPSLATTCMAPLAMLGLALLFATTNAW